jgi:hypothetical protein
MLRLFAWMNKRRHQGETSRLDVFFLLLLKKSPLLTKDRLRNIAIGNSM